MKYTYFYKKKYKSTSDLSELNYDVFISSYCNSDRVLQTFNCIEAKQKLFLLYNQDVTDEELEKQKVSFFRVNNSIEDLRGFVENFSTGVKYCIDTTGFIIPELLVLIKFLRVKDPNLSIDFIYTEPQFYKDREETLFSDEYKDVSSVIGFEGRHSSDTSNDLLIIGAGYETNRIVNVAQKKSNSRKVQLLGFPSLRPDMYQENVIKTYKAESVLGEFRNNDNVLYAPAYDPFYVAEKLSDFIKKENSRKSFTNIYLAPLSTKAHALGMLIFYEWESGNYPISIIHPKCDKYFSETTEGISEVNVFTVEFPKK